MTKLLEPAAGSSQPWFCLLEDGSEWLVKFAGAGPGADALVAEFIANGLGQHWGLPIPNAQVVTLDAGLARAGTDEFWDVLEASAGPNLAIQKIEGAENVVPDPSLPDELGLLVTFDTLLHNWDRTALSRNLLRDPKSTLWWIDHGSCRFLHALDREHGSALPSNHFLAGARAGGATLPCPERARVDELVMALPLPWLASAGLEPRALAQRLWSYLARAVG